MDDRDLFESSGVAVPSPPVRESLGRNKGVVAIGVLMLIFGGIGLWSSLLFLGLADDAKENDNELVALLGDLVGDYVWFSLVSAIGFISIGLAMLARLRR